MRSDLDQLRLLLAIADRGSFTAAAGERNMEVSAVSRSVRSLESALGVALFDRLARGVRLTIAGRSYVASARDILYRYERAGLDARQASSGRPMHLEVGLVWSATSKPVVDLFRRFAADCPNVAVAAVEAGNDDLIEQVRSGRLDVAIAATDPPPLHRLKPVSALSVLPLWLEPLSAVVPANVALEKASWDDLATARLLCRTVDDWPRFVSHVVRLGGPTLTFEPQAVSQEALLGLVAANLGWTLAPASLSHLFSSDVRSVPIVSQGASIQVEAVWRAENANPALARFLAQCRQLYAATSESAAPSQTLDRSP